MSTDALPTRRSRPQISHIVCMFVFFLLSQVPRLCKEFFIDGYLFMRFIVHAYIRKWDLFDHVLFYISGESIYFLYVLCLLLNQLYKLIVVKYDTMKKCAKYILDYCVYSHSKPVFKVKRSCVIVELISYSTHALKGLPIMRKRSVHLKPNIDLLPQ